MSSSCALTRANPPTELHNMSTERQGLWVPPPKRGGPKKGGYYVQLDPPTRGGFRKKGKKREVVQHTINKVVDAVTLAATIVIYHHDIIGIPMRACISK